MGKILSFFRKHTKLILMASQALLLVTSIAILTYVSLGIWTNDKQSQTLVSKETNPSEKYFTYYAAVPNISAEKGYDYYPLSTIPKELISSIDGLAVARYEGFETTVQIPAYPRVLIDGVVYNAEDETDSSKILPVKHVLYGYYNTADNLGSNGLANNSRITTLILPETLTYVYAGAFAQMTSLSKVSVRGTRTYEYTISCGYLDGADKKFKDQWEIYSDNEFKNLVDTLVLGTSAATGKHYYISATDYQQYEIDEDTFIFNYTSESTRRYFNRTTEEVKLYSITEKGPYVPSKVYFEDGAFTTNTGDAIKIIYQDYFYSTSAGGSTGSKGFQILWEDTDRSANAFYYTYDFISGKEMYGENSYMFSDSERRLTANDGYEKNVFEGYFIPSRQIANCAISFTAHGYNGTEATSTSFQVNLPGYTFNPGVKYHIEFDGSNINITGIKYVLKYTPENGSLISEDLVLDSYIKAKDNVSDPDYYIANEQTYEKYIKENNLILGNYANLEVYEVTFDPSDSNEAAKEELLVSSFDLGQTNAAYSDDNYAFNVTFSPNVVSSSVHYYSDQTDSNILKVSTIESRLNAEKIYYLNEVVRIQNEELIVYYHNVNNASTVFIVGYTPISTDNNTFAYYNGKEEARSTRYDDCVMTSAKGSIVGLYDKNGRMISKVYDASQNQILELYANRTQGAITSLSITNEGLFESLYDASGVAITKLYDENGEQITEIYNSKREKVLSLEVTVYDENYLEYHFDLRYGSPTNIKFSTGTKRDTVLPNNVITTTDVNNSLYTIYYESNSEQSHTINVTEGTTTKTYQMKYYTNGETYLYYYQFSAANSARFTFDNQSTSYSAKDYNNCAYVNGSWEYIYILESTTDLWYQAGAVMQLSYGQTTGLGNIVKGINIDTAKTLFTIPSAKYMQFLRCNPDDLSTWNTSTVIELTKDLPGGTYRITAWGSGTAVCIGKFVNNVNYLILDNYYEGTKAFAPVSETNDTPTGFSMQFSISGLSLSKGTSLYGAYLALSGSLVKTNSKAFNASADPNYTSDNSYISFNEATNTFDVKKDCKVDVYYKVSHNEDNNVFEYGFWFQIAGDNPDFVSTGYDFNEENFENADSFILASHHGKTSTGPLKFGSGTNDLDFNALNIITIKDISNTGEILYDITKISASNFIAVQIPEALTDYNDSNIEFQAYFAGVKANSRETTKPDDLWAKLYPISNKEVVNGSKYTTYVLQLPTTDTTHYPKMSIYGIEANTRATTKEYLYKTDEYSYSNYRNGLIRLSSLELEKPNLTYSLRSTSTGFQRENSFGEGKYKDYYFLYPTENLLYALKQGLIKKMDIDISGSVKYFTSRDNYLFNKDIGVATDQYGQIIDNETGQFNGGTNTILRHIKTTTITSSQLLNNLVNGAYAVRMPISDYDNNDAIIDEAHTVSSFIFTITFYYNDAGTNYESVDLINAGPGEGILNNYLRNQYLNLDCNLSYFENGTITRVSQNYDLSNKYGIYFNYRNLNNYEYYVKNSNEQNVSTDVIASSLYIPKSKLNNSLTYTFSSNKQYDITSKEAIFDIVNSYKMERNNSNTSYEEYYVLEDLTNLGADSKFIVSGVDKDNYTPGNKIRYYGDSNSDDSLGFMTLDAKKQIILFTPNQSSSYKTISYGIYNEAGALIGYLSYDAELTLQNGYQTFTASVPVLANKSNYFYIMSMGNNPKLIGRYLATDDGNLTYISSYSAKISTAASASGSSIVATVSKDYVIDAFKSDEMYALALKNSDGNFTQHYPYYLVGSFNNWNLDNTYGLTFDSTNNVRYRVSSSAGFGYHLGFTRETYKYYTITNVYLRAGDSYRISNVTSYFEVEGFTAAIQGEQDVYNHSSEYLSLATNGYTINVTKTGYYDIVFEEYLLINEDKSGGKYGEKIMYRTGAKLNEDNLYSVDLYFQNNVDWETVNVVGYNSKTGHTILNEAMTHSAGVINGSSNWYLYTYRYRSNDDIPDYIYFEGTGNGQVLRTTDLNFTITEDAEKSGQIFFTPKLSNNELVVNVDNTYFFIDASSIPNYSNYRYAIYFSNSVSDYSWVEFKQFDSTKPGIYYAKVESAYKNYQIAILNNKYSGFTLDASSNMVVYRQNESATLDNSENLYVISSTDSSTKSLTFASYTSTIFASAGSISLNSNQKLYAIFSNDATSEEVEMQLSDQNLYYAFNLNPNLNNVSFRISDGSNVMTSTAVGLTNNLYNLTITDGILTATGANHTNFQSYLYNDGTPYLYYLRTSDNWNANVSGLMYDKNTNTFVIEGVSLEKGVGIKLFDASGNAYMISSTYQDWRYDSSDLYSLIVDKTGKFTITAKASVGYVTAAITEYNEEYLKSFNIATAVVYDEYGIVASYNMIYTSNSSVIYNDMVYLKKGYRVYIYEANKEQYTYEYQVGDGYDGYYKLYIALKQIDNEKAYGWSNALNSQGQTVENVIILVSVSYKMLNFVPGAIYNGTYINLTNPSYRVNNNGIISYETVSDGALTDKFIEENDYPMQSYIQNKAYYAILTDEDGNRINEYDIPLTWSQTTNIESKNANYTAFITVPKRNVTVNVYDENNAPVGNMTISFPGHYELFYSNLFIYSSSNSSGKNNVMAYRLQGEGNYTLWIDDNRNQNLDNTYNSNYEEYMTNSSLNVSEKIDLALKPFYVKDSYGNIITKIDAVTLFDYEEITSDKASAILNDGGKIYTYNSKDGYQLASSVDNTKRYYSLEIKRVTAVPSGVYNVEYSTDNRRRTDDTYLVFTYVILKKIPAVKVQLFYIQSDVYNPDATYYSSTSVYTKYTGNGSDLSNVYELIEATEFDVTGTYYILEPTNGGYVLNQVKIDTFEKDKTYYTFSKANTYEENKAYYTYVYNKVSVDANTDFSSGNYFVYQLATSYEEGKQYYQLINGEYVPTGFNPLSYNLYTMEMITELDRETFDPNTNVYYYRDIDEVNNVTYEPVTDYTVKNDFYSVSGAPITNSSELVDTTTKYFMYNTLDKSYTLVDDLIIKNQYFTRQLLQTLKEVENASIYSLNGEEYVYTDKYYVKENTYYLGIKVSDSSNYKEGEKYFYLNATGSANNVSELALKKNQYYTMRQVQDGESVSGKDIYIENENGSYGKTDSSNGIPITDTSKAYYKRFAVNNASEYVTIDDDNYKGYYASATDTTNKRAPKLGVSAVITSDLAVNYYQGGNIEQGSRIASTDKNLTVLIKTNYQLYYASNGNSRLQPVSQSGSGTNLAYYYYYDENMTYYYYYSNGWWGQYYTYSIEDLALYNETTNSVMAYSNNIVVLTSVTNQLGKDYDNTKNYSILNSSSKTYQLVANQNTRQTLTRYYFEAISLENNNKNLLSFDNTYYYYKKITTYNGENTVIDSSADLVNGLYDDKGNIRTRLASTGERKIPNINASEAVYLRQEYTGQTLIPGQTYYTDNQNYRISIYSNNYAYYVAAQNNRKVVALYYDPDATYYWNSTSNQAANALSYHIVDLNGEEVTNAKIYTITRASGVYDETKDYYRSYQEEASYLSRYQQRGGYNTTYTMYTINYTASYLKFADDILFDANYNYDIVYLTPDGSGFSSTLPTIDYTKMFVPTVAVEYDRELHLNGNYYKAIYNGTTLSQLIKQVSTDNIEFDRDYYYKGNETNGYYKYDSTTDGYTYYESDNVILGAVMFLADGTLEQTRNVKLLDYYKFSEADSIYNGLTTYYLQDGDIYKEASSILFENSYYLSTNFNEEAGNSYVKNKKYALATTFNNGLPTKFVSKDLPYDIVDTANMFKGVLATTYIKTESYYFNKNNTGILYPFNLNNEFSKNKYYKFENATAYISGTDYYERDHYRTLVSADSSFIPAYYKGNVALYIKDLCNNGLAYTLDEISYQYGDKFDTTIYQNDGYWVTQDHRQFSKAEFYFKRDANTKYYSDYKIATTYDSSKKDAYYRITDNGLGLVVPTKEEFEEYIKTKKYYGLYNYYLAASEDNALPSYLEIGGSTPQDTDFAYWITRIYNEYPYMIYDDVMTDHGNDDFNIYNDNDVININYGDDISLFPTFTEATFKLFVQIGSGYTILDAEGKRLNDTVISSGNNQINFKVQIENGYVVDDTFRVYFVDSEGNVLKEWHTLDSSYSYTINPLKTVYLYVSVAPKTYKVTLDAPQTSLDKKEVIATYGSYVNFGEPHREGYTFLYWYDKNTGTVYTDNTGRSRTRWSTDSDITLSAAWDLLYETSISYVDADGNLLKDTIDSSAYTAGDLVRITIPNFLGYEFSSIEARDTNGNIISLTKYTQTYSFYMPEVNVAITVRYGLINYQINYNLDGGKLALGVTNKTTYTYNDSFTLNNPVKEGYRFIGWSGSGINGTTQYVMVPLNSTGNRSYTATWELIERKINYNFNIDDVNNPNKDIISILDGDFLLEAPSKNGYQFMGWYLDANYTLPFTGSLDYLYNDGISDINLYGKFELIQYIFFDIEKINSFDLSLSDYNAILASSLGASTNDPTTVNLATLLKNKNLFAYTYFFNENGDLQAWANASLVADSLYWSQVPNNSYTKAILVITNKEVDIANAGEIWGSRIMQTGNLVIGRDSTRNIVQGLFVLDGATSNGDKRYIILGQKSGNSIITPAATNDAIVTLNYTGSPLFDEALEKSGLSYASGTHGLKITFRSETSAEETLIVDTINGDSSMNDTSKVLRVGTYVIRIFDNATKSESLILLQIVKNNYDISGITFNDSIVKYDGTNKTISIEGILPAGLTVSYSYCALGSTDSSDVAPISVGTYIVTAHFSSDNPESYEAISDMEAYLIIYNDNNYYYVGSEPIYFGLYVNDRLTAILTKGALDEYQVTNISLNEGDKVYIMDSDGTMYLSWTNSEIPNAQAFMVKTTGKYSFYFNVATIKTSVDMPVTEKSDFYITYDYNGRTYKEFLYKDSTFRTNPDSAQTAQYYLELELPSGAVVNGYYPARNTDVHIDSLENYTYFGLETNKILNGVTINYTSTYKVYIKVYQNQTELYIGFTTTPIYVKFNNDLDVVSANVYYWTDGISGAVSWPGSSLTKLADYAQTDSQYTTYIGYVDVYADFIIFNYVNSTGSRVQSYNINYKYTDFINVYIIDSLDGDNSSIGDDTRPIYTNVGNQFYFDNSKYDITITDITGITASRVEGNKYITEVKSAALVSGAQEAIFKVIYQNKKTKQKGEFSLKYDGLGTENQPFLIYDTNDFYTFIASSEYANRSGIYFLQTNNIILSEDEYNKPYNKDLGFNNIYNGQNYEIRYQQEYYNITSKQDSTSDSQYNGVFGYVGSNGVIRNLTVVFRVINGRSSYGYVPAYYVGSIASFNDGLIDNVKAYATDKDLGAATLVDNFNVAVNNIRYFGGLVGYNNGKIINSTNKIGVTAWNWGASDSWIVGGIAGYNNGEIYNCVNSGVLVVNSNSDRSNFIGGIAGLNAGSITNSINSSDNPDVKVFVKSNNDAAVINDISTNVMRRLSVAIENSWFFVNETVTSTNGVIYRIESNLRIDYYKGDSLYTSRFYNGNDAINNIVSIDLLDDDAITRISISRSLIITTDNEDGRYVYHYHNNNGNLSFTKISDKQFVGFPANTYEVLIDRNDIRTNTDGIYYYVTKSITYYETSTNSNNSAMWSRYNLVSSTPSDTLYVHGLDYLFPDSNEYKVISYDASGTALGINMYDKTNSYIYIYPNQASMVFANYVNVEGSSKTSANYHSVTVDLAATNKDLYFYDDGTEIKYAFGYDPSANWDTTTLNLINMLTKSFASKAILDIRYENYNAATDEVTFITAVQYDINSSLYQMPIKMLKSEANCNRIVISVNNIDYSITIDLTNTNENEWLNYSVDKDLYLYLDGYSFLAPYTSLKEKDQILVNQYLDLLYAGYSDDVMVSHYNASGELFKIDAYANNSDLAQKYAVYNNNVLTNNVESNLAIYADTAKIIIKQLNAYNNEVIIDYNNENELLYIYNQGENHSVGGVNYNAGLKSLFLTRASVNATRNTIKVFNEVSWYANAGALMKVTYYDDEANIIGFRTYDVKVTQDIMLLTGTKYLEFCRLCQGAEYNYKSIDISGFAETDNILIQGDNVISKVSADYLPIDGTINLYNYVTGWLDGTLKVEYYSSLTADPIKTVEGISHNENNTNFYNISLYTSVKALKIYFLSNEEGAEYSKPIVVNTIDKDKNLYLTTTNEGENKAIWSKPLAISTGAYIPVVYSTELTYWSYIEVDYYTNDGILMTTISYSVAEPAIAYIKNAARMVIRINGSQEETLTISNITLEKTLRFQLNSLSLNSYRFVENNANNLNETARVSFVNTVSWWVESDSLTKFYYYKDDVLLTINVIESNADLVSIPIYDGTTKLKIVKLSGFNETNSIEVSAIYPSKILKLYSPSAGVANATWETKPLAADETIKYLYFNHKGLENVVGVNLLYVDGNNNSGSLTMEYDEKGSGYYRINWDSVAALNSKSIGFEVIYGNGDIVSLGNIATSSIDVLKQNVYNGTLNLFDELYNEYEALYLNVSRIAPWNDYYITVSDSTGSYTTKMTYLDSKSVYGATVLSKYLKGTDAKVEFHSSKDEYFYITSGTLNYDLEAANNTYILYGVGVIVGLINSSGDYEALINGGSRVDSLRSNFYDVSQYDFATIGAWTNLDLINDELLDSLFDVALEAVKPISVTKDLASYKADIMLDNYLQFYSYSVGGMNGWSVGTYLYGESFIGIIDGRYVFYNSLVLSDASEHKVQLSNSWDRSFSDDNNTPELEYSVDGSYVMSKFDGQQNIASNAGKYIIVFEVNSDSGVHADNSTMYNESGIHVISLKNKYTITWVIGEDTYEQTYSEGDTPSFKGDTPTKESTQKYDYLFSGWTPELTTVRANQSYEATFDAVLRKYTVTVIYKDVTKIYENISYGTRITDEFVERLDLSFGGYYYDENYLLSANGNYIREDTTLYAKVYDTGIYLIGTIENKTNWTRQDYKLAYDEVANTYQIKASLFAGDAVKLYNFAVKTEEGYGIYYDNFNVTGLTDACRIDTENNNLIITKAGNYTFTLRWENSVAIIDISISYVVSFVTNYSDIIIDSIEVNRGETITTPNPEHEGYVFVGWYTDSTFETAFDSITVINENTTLYAKWIIPETGESNEGWLEWI